ncbi:hypothetical protein WNY77_00050 [Paraglaciecola mesophila]|uniref:Uncharacterized protein n=1 Tax=Paraglaciecola mesophila TaxID=197222 RepID=A0ABU9SPH3_9ALTE
MPSPILVEQFLGHTLSQPGTSLAEHFLSWASGNGRLGLQGLAREVI